MNPALPDTSMKLGRYVYKHELFEIFSLANQNSNMAAKINIKSENGVLVSEKKIMLKIIFLYYLQINEY